jgi:hypothetical protein
MEGRAPALEYLFLPSSIGASLCWEGLPVPAHPTLLSTLESPHVKASEYCIVTVCPSSIPAIGEGKD